MRGSRRYLVVGIKERGVLNLRCSLLHPPVLPHIEVFRVMAEPARRTQIAYLRCYGVSTTDTNMQQKPADLPLVSRHHASCSTVLSVFTWQSIPSWLYI